MTTPANGSGEQPSNETVNATQAGAQPQDAPATLSFDTFSEDELLGAITGQPVDEAPINTPPATPDATPPADPPATQEPVNDDVSAAGDDTPAPADNKPPGRLSVRSLQADQQLELAQAIDMVRKGEASDTLEALQLIRGTTPQATPSEAAPATQQPATESAPANPPAQSKDEAAIQTEIEELRAQRASAKKDFDADLEEQLTEKIEDALVRLSEAKLHSVLHTQQAATQAAAYEDRYQAAVAELETVFPDVLDENSVMTRLLDDKVTAAIARKDPALQDPGYILKFAQEVAEMIGAKPATAQQPAPAAKVPAPPAAPRRGTASDLAPSTPAAGRPTAEQARQIIDQADPDTLLAALSAS